MNKSRGEEILEKKLDTLEPNTPRYLVIEAALQFKSSWVRLGEELVSIFDRHTYREWGFRDFEAYCRDEIRITRETAMKLCRSYGFLVETRPALVEQFASSESPPRVPDYKAIDFLRRIRENDRVPEEVYSELSSATFDEDLSAVELRRRAKEELPDLFAKKPTPRLAPRRHLQAALSQTVRLIETLHAVENIDDSLLDLADALRLALVKKLEEVDSEPRDSE